MHMNKESTKAVPISKHNYILQRMNKIQNIDREIRNKWNKLCQHNAT